MRHHCTRRTQRSRCVLLSLTHPANSNGVWDANKILFDGQAKMHGNEPSKGAKIDAELQAEEEELMKKKGQNLPGKKM